MSIVTTFSRSATTNTSSTSARTRSTDWSDRLGPRASTVRGDLRSCRRVSWNIIHNAITSIQTNSPSSENFVGRRCLRVDFLQPTSSSNHGWQLVICDVRSASIAVLLFKFLPVLMSKQSFLPRTICDWNRLPPPLHIKSSVSHSLMLSSMLVTMVNNPRHPLWFSPTAV